VQGASYHVAGVGDLAPIWVAVGDFNGDGRIDLAVTASAVGQIDILLGNGDGTFQPPVTYAAGGKRPQSVAVGDFNGDGNLDLVVANTGSQSVGVLLGNGDGAAAASRSSSEMATAPSRHLRLKSHAAMSRRWLWRT